jgi:hypothetical protein
MPPIGSIVTVEGRFGTFEVVGHQCATGQKYCPHAPHSLSVYQRNHKGERVWGTQCVDSRKASVLHAVTEES